MKYPSKVKMLPRISGSGAAIVLCGLIISINHYLVSPSGDKPRYLNADGSQLLVNGCCGCQFNDTLYLSESCEDSAFMRLLQTVITSKCDITEPCRRLGTDFVQDNEWYDFVIVGAGLAGPVIARRLSDNARWSVLLIEAGPEEPSLTALPGMAFHAINTSLDWRYRTEPSSTACLDNGGVCAWPRGKMVSGTAGMYGMMYVRGHPSSYDDWAKLGCTGWSYREIKRYFERAENPGKMYLKHTRTNNESSSEGSPMYIDFFQHQPAFLDEILRAGRELGYHVDGVTAKSHTGFMLAPMITKDGIRGTTSKYYLRPVKGRPNLKVLTNAHVTRVLYDSKTRRALGVELIDSENQMKKVMVNKEVVLTAGTIGSAQILLQSGIGPREDLERLNITVIRNLLVGRNLQNHVSVSIEFTIRDETYETLSIDSLLEYIDNRTGPLASTGLTQATAFLESSHTVKGIPDIQVFFDGFSPRCTQTGLNYECTDGSLGMCSERRKIFIRPTVIKTRSRGYLKLRSRNPLDHPLIYPNYFADETDVKILLEGIRKVIELTKTKTMRKWNLTLENRYHHTCSMYIFATDEYFECLIRAKTDPENHQSGTCKMGSSKDKSAVVDPELRLIGISNLRVADASIFPILPNTNPAAPIVMVAEKAADMIQNTWLGN